MRCKYDDVTDATFPWSYGGGQLSELLLVSEHGPAAPDIDVIFYFETATAEKKIGLSCGETAGDLEGKRWRKGE